MSKKINKAKCYMHGQNSIAGKLLCTIKHLSSWVITGQQSEWYVVEIGIVHSKLLTTDNKGAGLNVHTAEVSLL